MRSKIDTLFATVASLTILVLASTATGATYGNESREYEDPEDDVVLLSDDRVLETLYDVRDLPDRKAPESKERLSVDIVGLTVLQNETYVSYIIEMAGPVYARPEYGYSVSGYVGKEGKEIRETDPFDFVLRSINGTAEYLVWDQGDFRSQGNVSRFDIQGHSLNFTMHRSRFVLKDRTTPHFLVAIAIIEPSEGGDRMVDGLEAGKTRDDRPFLGETEVLALQIGFIVMVFVAIFVIYGIWSRRKGDAIAGGVCPKCESRLDPSLNFCPSCGTMIRGPASDPQSPSPASAKGAGDEE